MRYGLPTLIAAMLVVTASAAVQQALPVGPTECLDTPQALEAAQAYETYCARCHEAGELSRKWFGSTPTTDEGRIRELALFLDRHSGCPHDQHELIARWLAERSGSGQ